MELSGVGFRMLAERSRRSQIITALLETNKR